MELRCPKCNRFLAEFRTDATAGVVRGYCVKCGIKFEERLRVVDRSAAAGSR